MDSKRLLKAANDIGIRGGIQPSRSNKIPLEGVLRRLASLLFISTSTVKNHIYHIYRKTGARNRIELLNAIVNSANIA